MVLTVGRIVHYVSYGTPGGEYPSACRAAVVTAVPLQTDGRPDKAALAVLNPEGMFFNPAVPYDDGTPNRPAHNHQPEPLCDARWHAGGTWHWPARVE